MKAELCLFALLLTVLPAAEPVSAREGSLDRPNEGPKGLRLSANSAVTPPAVKISSAAGRPVQIGLAPPVNGVRFVRIRGIPSNMKLSQGFRTSDAWVAPSIDLERLEVVPPPGFEGVVALEIFYYRDLQKGIAAQSTLAIEFKPRAQAPTTPERDQPPKVAAANPDLSVPSEPQDKGSTISPEQEGRSLQKGANLMKAGDIAAARLIFEELARKNSADGARALAETFDPKILGGVLIAGLHPDIDLAKKWYRRAAELGDREASARMVALDAR
jgi:hypothetical protein